MFTSHIKASKEAFENNMHYHDKRKTLRKLTKAIGSVLRRSQLTIFSWNWELMSWGLYLQSFESVRNKLLNTFTDHFQLVNKPTHIFGSLIDHVYIK